jgi:hypothetical protein
VPDFVLVCATDARFSPILLTLSFEELMTYSFSMATEQAAEKLRARGSIQENIPRRLKPDIGLIEFSGTDESVPFQNWGFP